MAETFTFRDGHGTSLGDVTRLDTLNRGAAVLRSGRAIGQDMDHADITAALESWVMTDSEMEEYLEHFVNSQPLDILDEKAADNEELAERLRRFEIEILAPKRKETQVLQAAPITPTPLSAHICHTFVHVFYRVILLLEL